MSRATIRLAVLCSLVMFCTQVWTASPADAFADALVHQLQPVSTVTDVGPAQVCLAEWVLKLDNSQDNQRYRPLTHNAAEWYGSTFFGGPDWTRVGKDWHHPGNDTPSVRKFTVPREGSITISGRVWKGDITNGDGVRVEIRHRRVTVWEAELEFDDATGVEPALTLDVQKGDAIRFVVHKRGKITCDTTYWDPVIAYADGERYQASETFSDKPVCGGVWSHEMEVQAGAEDYLPRLHAFTNPGRYTVTRRLDAPVRLTHREALPYMVIADSADQTGVALSWDGGAWEFTSAPEEDDRIRIRVIADRQDPMPKLTATPYQGNWIKGLRNLDESGDGAELAALIQQDWEKQDGELTTAEDFVAAAENHLARAKALINDIRADHGDHLSREIEGILDKLAEESPASLEEARLRYARVRGLKRTIALSNRLIDFGPMLFTKRVPTSYSHLVMQYYGWRARPGGGLYVLENPGQSLETRDILRDQLPPGNVLEPRLSYDGKRIVFSYVICRDEAYDYNTILNDVDEGFYHIYEINVDGTGLRQLTSGPYDDLMPTYLPDGGIAFCSTRRKGYARCFGAQFSRRWHVYTLHRMEADGSDLKTLSYHDTNEWFPTVSNSGLLLYSRWDYIDRDAVTHQNLWATRPDGTNPIALWGNAAPSPHCTFQIQPVPGSHKLMFTASAHHSITAGSLALLDPTVDANSEDAITRLTPEIPFPEAESRDITEYYAAPWPLSEKYYLTAYSPTPLVWEPGANLPNALGIYLLDAAGNRELIYRDPDIGSTNPIPLRPRRTPPILPSQLEYMGADEGEMVLTDIYEGLGDVPRGSIKALRIVQIFPKTTHEANNPPIGMAGEENGRAVLGTVPVEPDGSARLIVPARTPLLFQALDKNGFAYQTMRSLTYVQPGETVSCVGCHEDRMSAPTESYAMAMQRPASRIEPGPLDGSPFSFMLSVQPVLDKHCVECHSENNPDTDIDLTGEPHEGFTRSYWALCDDRQLFWGEGTNPDNAREALVPRFGGRNQIQVTPPGGAYGALGSRLIRILRDGHYDVSLSDEEYQRLAQWIDCNAVFYGATEPTRQARQLRGERIEMPELQ